MGDDNRVDFLIAEFGQLRNEILARSSAQQSLLRLNITSTAIISALVLDSSASSLLLLMIPLLSCSLGFLYIDHAYTIRGIGRYINSHLRPLAVELASSERILFWEQHRIKFDRPYSTRIIWALPTMFVFEGSAAAALTLTIVPATAAKQDVWPIAFWFIGATLSAVLFLVWVFIFWLGDQVGNDGHRGDHSPGK
jgi:hypothetical protein